MDEEKLAAVAFPRISTRYAISLSFFDISHDENVYGCVFSDNKESNRFAQF